MNDLIVITAFVGDTSTSKRLTCIVQHVDGDIIASSEQVREDLRVPADFGDNTDCVYISQ